MLLSSNRAAARRRRAGGDRSIGRGRLLRYYRLDQLARRAGRLAWRASFRDVGCQARRRPESACNGDSEELRHIAQWRLERHRRGGGAERAKKLLVGRIRFQNIKRSFPSRPATRKKLHASYPYADREYINICTMPATVYLIIKREMKFSVIPFYAIDAQYSDKSTPISSPSPRLRDVKCRERNRLAWSGIGGTFPGRNGLMR